MQQISSKIRSTHIQSMESGGEEVKILGGWLSPFVMRPRIALNIKGVNYEFLQETFGSKSELLLKSNPVYKKVPVLIHNGKPVCESMIIVQYIDEVWTSGPAIAPADPYDRAVARFWAVYIDDKIFQAIMGIGMGPTPEAKAEGASQLSAGLQLLEEAFKDCSKGKGFFGGNTVGYLDIAFGSLLGWFKAIEIITSIKFLDDEKTPLLVGWAERFCSDSAVKEVMPDTEKLVEVMPETEKLVEFGKMLVAKMNAPH